MKLVVGLGNPDKEYQNTFHNLGFMCADKVAEKLSATFSKQKCRADIAETFVKKEKVIIAKPLTYMNLSGESVKELVDFYKIPLSNLIVLYDDFDLEKGAVRIRKNGSSGTHNGMRNIIKELNSSDFARIRVGFKPEGENRIPLIDLVLSGIKQEDKKLFDDATTNVANATIDYLSGLSFDNLMQKYNCKNKN